jgi:hypothetical protein
VLIAAELYLVRTYWPGLSRRGWLIVGGVTLAYVAMAHVVRIHHDPGDLGLFGGLMDNPFSFSDDVNRLMLFLQVLLLPGRLIAESVLGVLRWVFGDGRRE